MKELAAVSKKGFNLWKLSQGEFNNINKLINNEEIDIIIKNFLS